MKRTEVTSEFLHLVQLHLEIDLTGKLSDSTRSHLDSLELVQTVVACEQHFKITITNEQIESLETFDDLINFIHDAKAIAI